MAFGSVANDLGEGVRGRGKAAGNGRDLERRHLPSDLSSKDLKLLGTPLGRQGPSPYPTPPQRTA